VSRECTSGRRCRCLLPRAAAPQPPAAPRSARAGPAHTRISGIRAGLIAGFAALIAVMIFIIQNPHAVSISFLGAHLRLPAIRDSGRGVTSYREVLVPSRAIASMDAGDRVVPDPGGTARFWPGRDPRSLNDAQIIKLGVRCSHGQDSGCGRVTGVADPGSPG
jgi:hypothetical protein